MKGGQSFGILGQGYIPDKGLGRIRFPIQFSCYTRLRKEKHEVSARNGIYSDWICEIIFSTKKMRRGNYWSEDFKSFDWFLSC